MIGKGYPIQMAKLDMNMIAEGYFASKSIHIINQNYQVEMPIAESVYRILYEGVSPRKEIIQLTEKLN